MEQEKPPQKNEWFRPTRRQFIERTVLSTVVSTMAGSVLMRNLEKMAGFLGEKIDELNPAESIGPSVIAHLQARESNEPTVQPDPRPKKLVEIPIKYDAVTPLPIIRISPELAAQLRGQFSRSELSSGNFTYQGLAIATTREGLLAGTQQFVAIFAADTTALGIGFADGRMVYLDTSQNPAEWEDVVTQENTDSLSIAAYNQIWKQLQPSSLIQQTAELLLSLEYGNRTLQKHNHQPFGAILPTTKMPHMSTLLLSDQTVASHLEDMLDLERITKPYYITSEGMVIDLIHLTDKSRQVYQWISQIMYYRALAQKVVTTEENQSPDFILQTKYYAGGPDIQKIQYQLTGEKLQEPLDSLLLELQAIFTIWSESILQGYLRTVVRDRFAIFNNSLRSANSPEDPISNTLSAHFTQIVMKNQQLKFGKKIESTVASWLKIDHVLTPAELDELSLNIFSYQEFNELKKEIIKVLYKIAPPEDFKPGEITLPQGFYPFIPNTVFPSEKTELINQLTVPKNSTGIDLLTFPNLSVMMPFVATKIKERSGFTNLFQSIENFFKGKF